MKFEIWEDDLGFTLIPEDHSQKISNPDAIFTSASGIQPAMVKAFNADSWEDAVEVYDEFMKPRRR